MEEPPHIPPAHEILVASRDATPEDIAALRTQCYDLRIAVFVREQGFPLDLEIDEIDDTATHFLLRLVPSLQPIGTIRASKPAHATYYKLGRLAVHKDHRKHNFGRELVLALHQWVRAHATAHGSQGHVHIVCHSQIPVKAFYAKFGYAPEGGEFVEDGAPHQKLVARLPLSD